MYTELLKPIVDVIKEKTKAGKIFLIGKTVTQSCITSVFEEPVVKQAITQLHLVVLTPFAERVKLQQKLENRWTPALRVNLNLMAEETFNRLIKAGDFFALKVVTQAELVYDNGKPLEQGGTYDQAAAEKEVQVNYTSGRNNIQEFLWMYEQLRQRKQNKLAAVMLHQAFEHTLVMLIKTCYGYAPKSHNLERVLRHCQMVLDIDPFLPDKSQVSIRSFELLNEAYVKGRYEPDFDIKGRFLDHMHEKIIRLIEAVIAVCLKHMRKGRPQPSFPFLLLPMNTQSQAA